MSDENKLAVQQPAVKAAPADFSLDRITDSFANTQRVAKLLAESGLFQAPGIEPSRTMAMCAVKIMMGRDMGLSPTQAMTGIHIIEGKPVASSLIQATFLRRAVDEQGKQRFRYTVEKLTDTECDASLWERIDGQWEKTGNVHVNIQRCPTVGKNGMKQNWKNHPDDMLFKTAIVKLIRRYAPEVLGGVPPEVDIEDEPVQRPLTMARSAVSALPSIPEEPQEVQDADFDVPEPSQPDQEKTETEQVGENDDLLARFDELNL